MVNNSRIMLKIFLIVLVIFFSAKEITGQWIKASGMLNQQVTCLAKSGSNIFAGTYGNGIFISTDNGLNWSVRNTGLSVKYILSLKVDGNKIFAGTDAKGAFLSTNDGMSWSSRSSGFPINPYVKAFEIMGNDIYAGTSYGIFHSTNNGANWISASTGLPFNTYDRTSYVYSINIFTTKIFAGTSRGIYQSKDYGETWSILSQDLKNELVTCLATINSYLFAGTFSGVFISTDDGMSWKLINSGLQGNYIYVKTLVVNNSDLFVGTFNGIFYSSNNGADWKDANLGLPSNLIVNSLTISGSYLIAATNDNGIWRRPLSDIISSVENYQSNFISNFRLDQNYPNPFNPTTKISFALPKRTDVILKVFNILGKEISILLNKELNPGEYEIEFDGKDLSSGVYFYTLITDGFIETKKLLLIK